MKALIDKLRIYGLKRFFYYVYLDLKNKIWLQMIKGSYSQTGEDLVIDKLLGYKKNGFYLDIGAFDPHRFSNTKRFYLRGWHGINIEPDENNLAKFNIDRPRDTNLNMGVGNADSSLNFYKFIPETLSTFSKKEADNYIQQGYKFIKREKVPVHKLSTILEKYAKDQPIDFMTSDTEGFEMEVLNSNNWKKFRPRLICIESQEHTIKEESKAIPEIEEFLNKKGYKKVFDNKLNSIYLDQH